MFYYVSGSMVDGWHCWLGPSDSLPVLSWAWQCTSHGSLGQSWDKDRIKSSNWTRFEKAGIGRERLWRIESGSQSAVKQMLADQGLDGRGTDVKILIQI